MNVWQCCTVMREGNVSGSGYGAEVEPRGLRNLLGNDSCRDVSNIFGRSKRKIMCKALSWGGLEREQPGERILGVIFGQIRIKAPLRLPSRDVE